MDAGTVRWGRVHLDLCLCTVRWGSVHLGRAKMDLGTITGQLIGPVHTTFPLWFSRAMNGRVKGTVLNPRLNASKSWSVRFSYATRQLIKSCILKIILFVIVEKFWIFARMLIQIQLQAMLLLTLQHHICIWSMSNTRHLLLTMSSNMCFFFTILGELTEL
jgi:hypothetical protein